MEKIRIKAFTLVELAIVMLISVILFGIAYYSWQILEQRFNNYTSSAIEIGNIERLQYQLSQDFKNSNEVMAIQQINGIIIDCKTDTSRVQYLFSKDNIQRQQSVLLDTFKIIPKQLKLFLLNNELNNFQMPTVIDEIDFQANYHNELILFNSNKKYSSLELLESGL